MTVCVFVGPTLRDEEARSLLQARYSAPVAQGDVYRAALEKPCAIGIIDGYFERMASVWHKEILWAMSQGIRVYGSASMGALRAAELTDFGMIGVGAIFEAFRAGELEDDDEVAVAHGSEHEGYRAFSDAMVNIRATMRRAVADGAVARSTADALVHVAKSLFYSERAYPTLLRMGRQAGLPQSELEALGAWLPQGRVDQKRDDAFAMLRKMSDDLESAPPPLQVGYTFEHTVAWEMVTRTAASVPPAAQPGSSVRAPDPIDHDLAALTRDRSLRQGALARVLALEIARARGLTVEGVELHGAIETFRHDRGLADDADFERWLEAQEVHDLQFFRDEALVCRIERLFEAGAQRVLPDYLRSTGQYDRLIALREERHRAHRIPR